jgi:hypothetical protein
MKKFARWPMLLALFSSSFAALGRTATQFRPMPWPACILCTPTTQLTRTSTATFLPLTDSRKA